MGNLTIFWKLLTMLLRDSYRFPLRFPTIYIINYFKYQNYFNRTILNSNIQYGLFIFSRISQILNNVLNILNFSF